MWGGAPPRAARSGWSAQTLAKGPAKTRTGTGSLSRRTRRLRVTSRLGRTGPHPSRRWVVARSSLVTGLEVEHPGDPRPLALGAVALGRDQLQPGAFVA